MHLRLFWKLGLTYLALLLAVLLGVDLYAVRALRNNSLRASFERLEALAGIARAEPPQVDDAAALRAWVGVMAGSGARITVIRAGGRVLADSAHDPETTEDYANGPEIQQAFLSGEGRAARHSTTLDRDLVYLALRHQPQGREPVVLRFALPLRHMDEALAKFRRRLWGASFLILLAVGGASLLISRSFSTRIRLLKAFSRRVADGDFRPMAVERTGDELTELARALNEAAARLDQTIRSLTDERNRSSAILRSMVEGVAVIGADERIVFSNHAFAQILGLEAAACEGRRPVEVIRSSELLGAIGQVLAGHETVHTEVVMGTVRPRSFAVTAARVAALRGLEGRAEGQSGAVLVLHDISELRRLERVRRDFVANVSHELRTPLTAIQGFAETLLAGALDDRENRGRFLEIIRDQAKRLARLTDDLLKLSLIEAGRLELELQPVGVAGLLRACVETAQLKAEPKQLTVHVECPRDLPPARGDARRLQEVVENLLDNAVQYTPAGGRITVRAQAADGTVVITVADTGIGIPRADQERIFERFYRVDAARSRKVGGTGLGLAIARHIVEAHGGHIWVKSEVGQGSEFHLSIPAAG